MNLYLRLPGDDRLHDVVGGYGRRVFTRCGLEGDTLEEARYVSGGSINADLLCPECDLSRRRRDALSESVEYECRVLAFPSEMRPAVQS